MSVDELVYDWNTIDPALIHPKRHIGFDDETLRDGLQSPSVCEPPVEKKIELIHLMNALGVDTVDIGLPGAGGTHATGVELMAREIAEKKLKIRPNCAARTHRNESRTGLASHPARGNRLVHRDPHAPPASVKADRR